MIMPLGNRNSHPVLLSSVRRQRKSTADSLTHGDDIRQKDLTLTKVCGIKSTLSGEGGVRTSFRTKHQTLRLEMEHVHHTALHSLLPVLTISCYRMFKNQNKYYTPETGILPKFTRMEYLYRTPLKHHCTLKLLSLFGLFKVSILDIARGKCPPHLEVQAFLAPLERKHTHHQVLARFLSLRLSRGSYYSKIELRCVS